ncbi:MAG TPA: 23S rRNA (pseudouridine(1915)-N(3))-methyltransferase RlmH [Marinilabiliales bacterium]|jgi:23S rRNA (pseudouridine1915-N3)-methyltransferase|nr:MAG: 23S rRNA (pseudouridine(1915)-N(3))-methyltransferase RlmH [Bacteroidetes bacterium GWA2_40_14]OFX62438.1 MAG: 23S rRNA (pseudouridine(1915)-N(3))-methyltransferase RlmH [Bacteroidetes bacterium GWC2_40_13]OFX72274.1 MAG: 23S rRNA (pseudouridine(1915)-N(3))-methyltransferase RlmH [Bacteroidetes bacterium GWD2_40_43]OFX90478.1 MAG: 23S rRNA (pseudouridine(1915)-N(3))-methyltransferase RlmH [Bacteroidetes bacterium GWE2_40_63]OFY17276.1 MAG: 23S rRNA (pseudouridine(1915)-N(3))-methyltrans
MKATLLVIGKTDDSFIAEGINKFMLRINRYMSFDVEVIPDLRNSRNLTEQIQKEKEGELILKKIQSGDILVLLDENGQQFSSVAFSEWLNTQLVSGQKRLVFVIGGPYGFSQAVYQKASYKISLSKMTFSHQLVRLIFVEQFYRVHTILKGEPYHHQ